MKQWKDEQIQTRIKKIEDKNQGKEITKFLRNVKRLTAPQREKQIQCQKDWIILIKSLLVQSKMKQMISSAKNSKMYINKLKMITRMVSMKWKKKIIKWNPPSKNDKGESNSLRSMSDTGIGLQAASSLLFLKTRLTAKRTLARFFEQVGRSHKVLFRFSEYSISIQDIKRRLYNHMEVKKQKFKETKMVFNRVSIMLKNFEKSTQNYQLRLCDRMDNLSDELFAKVVNTFIDIKLNDYIRKRWNSIRMVNRRIPANYLLPSNIYFLLILNSFIFSTNNLIEISILYLVSSLKFLLIEQLFDLKSWSKTTKVTPSKRWSCIILRMLIRQRRKWFRGILKGRIIQRKKVPRKSPVRKILTLENGAYRRYLTRSMSQNNIVFNDVDESIKENLVIKELSKKMQRIEWEIKISSKEIRSVIIGMLDYSEKC